MTPAVKALQKANIIHRVHTYKHDSGAASYGTEAAEKLDLDPARVFKTLVAMVDNTAMVVAIVPVTGSLCLKSLAAAHGGKRAEMADKQKVQRTTGYVLGGVSPIGQRKALPTWIDASAKQYTTIFVSGGKRGLEVELAAQDLANVTRGQFADLATD
ncbi:MAG: hypothetical protein RL336_139 [Pseudomonadota bacterium]|jgi:Cys-tRNA(Pro)/Cys-tRNA(Cys) deacylase